MSIYRCMRRVCYGQVLITGMLLISIQISAVQTINDITQIPAVQTINDIDSKFGCRLRLPGQKCNSKDVRFFLFDSVGNTEGIELNINKLHAGPHFNPFIPMKVIIHGFEGGIPAFNPTYLIKEAYMQQENYNIIVVNWNRLSTAPCYNIALVNTKYVGECTGQLLVALERTYPTFIATEAHVIGFSYGCHVAAEASRTVQRLTSNKLRRVTGLDPRQSNFYKTLGFTWLIDPSCADFVDIIYTNAGDQGREEMKGVVEFYVNGGSTQKQCSKPLVERLCSHLTAPVYYAESVASSTGFFGVSCPGLAQYQAGQCPNNQTDRVSMGPPCCPPGTTGRYYVTTASSSPYALG